MRKLEKLGSGPLTIRVLGFHCCRVLNLEKLDGIQQGPVGGVEGVGIENDGRGACDREVTIQPVTPDINPIRVQNVGPDDRVTGSGIDPELPFRLESHGRAKLREVEGQVRLEAVGRLVEREGEVV